MPSGTEGAVGRVSRRRITTVARREFVATVSRKGYLATLLLMPVLMLGVALLPAIGVALSGGPEQMLGLGDPDQVTRVGVVDGTRRGAVDPRWVAWHNEDQERAAREGRRLPEGEVQVPELPPLLAEKAGGDPVDRGGFDSDARIELVVLPDAEQAVRAVRSEEVAVAYVLEADYFERGRVRVLLPRRNPMNPGIYAGRMVVARLLRQSIAAPHLQEQDALARLLQVMEPRDEVVGVEGEAARAERSGSGLDEAMAVMLPVLFASFFAMSIFVASGYLLDGVGEEKENRVLEVLLSSVTPEELLLGKMLGLGGAGLLQTLFFAGLGLGPLFGLGLLSVGAGTLLGMVACTVLGYAQYASLMGASGAVGGNRHEGRQISAVWTLSAASPMFVLPVFIAGPDKAFPVALSLFPLTAPIAMTIRLGLGSVPGWQLGLCFLLLAGTAWVSWRVGSRVFRVAILLTGARPSVAVIWSWVRGG